MTLLTENWFYSIFHQIKFFVYSFISCCIIFLGKYPNLFKMCLISIRKIGYQIYQINSHESTLESMYICWFKISEPLKNKPYFVEKSNPSLRWRKFWLQLRIHISCHSIWKALQVILIRSKFISFSQAFLEVSIYTIVYRNLVLVFYHNLSRMA